MTYNSHIFEAIDMFNEHIDKLQELAEVLLKQYPDVENTPVDEAFSEAYSSVIGLAIHFCCEANGVDGAKWATSEDWHVICDE